MIALVVTHQTQFTLFSTPRVIYYTADHLQNNLLIVLVTRHAQHFIFVPQNNKK